MASETYVYLQAGTTGVASPVNGTIKQITSVMGAGFSLSIGFDPAGANPVFKLVSGAATNDVSIVIPVSIPVKIGKMIFATHSDATLTLA